MMLLGPTQLRLAALILTVFLGRIATGEGFKQEIWLYPEGGDGLYFDTHVPDLSIYSPILSKNTTICANGMWLLSTAVNYEEYYYIGGYASSDIYCEVANMTPLKSLRHFAANDTATDAISLYSGDYWTGEEIFVTMSKANISISIESLAASATSNWMLYEENNFEGKSICYQVPYLEFEFSWDHVRYLDISKIGSVFKGCDLDEIQLYRESLLL